MPTNEQNASNTGKTNDDEHSCASAGGSLHKIKGNGGKGNGGVNGDNGTGQPSEAHGNNSPMRLIHPERYGAEGGVNRDIHPGLRQTLAPAINASKGGAHQVETHVQVLQQAILGPCQMEGIPVWHMPQIRVGVLWEGGLRCSPPRIIGTTTWVCRCNGKGHWTRRQRICKQKSLWWCQQAWQRWSQRGANTKKGKEKIGHGRKWWGQ